MIDARISRESSRLIASLDADTRYILFEQYEHCYCAAICSQVSDKTLAHVESGNGIWTFDDKEKAIRSIRRLNKDVQIYTGSYRSTETD